MNRRDALKGLAAGAAVFTPVVASAGVSSRPGASLVAPAQVGSSLYGWTFTEITDVVCGGITVELKSDAGDKVRIAICARETPVRAPVSTAKTELFVVNYGTGETPTNAQHTRAARIVAALIEENETHAKRILAELMPLSERVKKYGPGIIL